LFEMRQGKRCTNPYIIPSEQDSILTTAHCVTGL
jgi:hypothetical protein